MVGCTNCGKNIPGLCRWCPGCGTEVWPLLLSNQPDEPNEVTCPNCGKFNFSAAEKCRWCGTPLVKANQPVIGENQGQGRGGRISLSPDDLPGGSTSSNSKSNPPAAGPQAGGRLSRLAQARNKYESEKKTSTDSGDWLSSLRPDGSAASARNLPPAPPPPVESSSQDAPQKAIQADTAFIDPASPAQDSSTGPGDAPSGDFDLPAVPEPVNDVAEVAAPIEDDVTQVNPALGELPDDSTLPDWLKELGTDAPPKVDGSRPIVPSSLNTGDLALSGDNLPQWLRDFAAESSPLQAPPSAAPVPPPSSKMSPAASTGPVAPAPKPDDDADLPEWLRTANGDNSKVEAPETPKRDILDWLKGPNNPDSTPPARPSFGDVDVEERLNFAFDESNLLNSNDPGRPRSGLTNILGFSPYAPDEVMGATPPAGSKPEQEPTTPPVNQNPRNFPTQTVFLDDLASLEEAPGPEAEAKPGSGNLRDLPSQTVFLDDLAMADEAPDESTPQAEGNLRNLPSQTVFLDDLSQFEDAPQDAIAPANPPSNPNDNSRNLPSQTVFLDDLSQLEEIPELNPPVEESSRGLAEHTVFLNDLASLDEAPPALASTGNGLRPWLAGLQPPTLETAPGPVAQSAEGTDSPASDLKPWLAGLQPPTLEGGPVAGQSQTGGSKMPSDGGQFTPDYIQNVRSKGTRPFSVEAMLNQSSLVADQLAGIPEVIPDPAQSGPGPSAAGENKSGPNPGEEPDSDSEGFAPGADLTGQELPDKETLSALLATLPDLPDLSLEGTSSGPADTKPGAARPAGSPRSNRFSFGYLDNETGDLADDIPNGMPSGEVPRPLAHDQDKSSTFELPEFLANPDAVPSTGSEPPTWQRLYVPETPPETGEPEAVTEEDSAGEAMASQSTEVGERPGIIAPATPTGSETAASTAEPPQDEDEGWAAKWSPDTEAPMPAATDPANAATATPDVPATPSQAGADVLPAEEEDDIPGWLRALSASGPVEAAPPRAVSGYTEMNQGSGPAETSDENAELPDWLQDEADQSASAASTAPARETPTNPPKPLQPKGSPVEERELPDWLKENTDEPELDLVPPPAEVQSPANLPDWLKEPEAPALTFGPEDYTGPTMPREREEGPPVDYTALLQEVPGTPFNNTNFFSDVEGPAWLQKAVAPKPPEQTQTPETTGTAATSENALPAWLRQVAPPPNAAPEPETARVIPPATSNEVEEAPLTNEAETEPATAPEPEEEEVPSVNLPPRLASAAVLETLLLPNAPAAVEEAPVKVKQGFRLSGSFIRYILFILLIAVAIFGLLRPLPIGSLTVSPNVQAFYDQIDGLPANSKVLVAFDWDADRYGEMGPLSTAVVQHIMAKRARVVTLSLSPQGPALAARITDELATNPTYGNGSFYKYGSTYLNLGWRSGQEAALRSLFSSMGDLTDYKNGQRAGDLAVTAGINSLADFDLIVVLAGDEGSVRTWVEQVGIQPGAHMVLGVPQAVEPVARPYAQGLATANPSRMSSETQPRAQALLAGLNQTAQYDQLLQDKLNLKTDPTVGLAGRLTAQSLAALLLIVVIVLVNVFYLVRRRR